MTLFLIGAGFLYAGLRHRQGVLAGRQPADKGDGARPLHPSLAVLGDILPGVIVAGLGWLGIKVTLAYIVFEGSRLFSLFDLAGFLFALTGYAVWLVCKTRFRQARDRDTTREPDTTRDPDTTLAPAPAAAPPAAGKTTQLVISQQAAQTRRARPVA